MATPGACMGWAGIIVPAGMLEGWAGAKVKAGAAWLPPKGLAPKAAGRKAGRLVREPIMIETSIVWLLLLTGSEG